MNTYFELTRKLINVDIDDELISFYRTNATNTIAKYLNDKTLDNDDIQFEFNNEVIELTAYYINKATMSQKSQENGNVKSLSNGGRSVTFMTYDEINAIGVPETIKARLPKPKVTIKMW